MSATVDKIMAKREEKLKAAIKALGGGKNKIAESLKAKKIKGVRGSTEDCPFAHYAGKVFPKASCVEVDVDTISVGFDNGEFIDLNLPKAVTAFIEAFDDGEYDFLAKEEE